METEHLEISMSVELFVVLFLLGLSFIFGGLFWLLIPIILVGYVVFWIVTGLHPSPANSATVVVRRGLKPGENDEVSNMGISLSPYWARAGSGMLFYREGDPCLHDRVTRFGLLIRTLDNATAGQTYYVGHVPVQVTTLVQWRFVEDRILDIFNTYSSSRDIVKDIVSQLQAGLLGGVENYTLDQLSTLTEITPRINIPGVQIEKIRVQDYDILDNEISEQLMSKLKGELSGEKLGTEVATLLPILLQALKDSGYPTGYTGDGSDLTLSHYGIEGEKVFKLVALAPILLEAAKNPSMFGQGDFLSQIMSM